MQSNLDADFIKIHSLEPPGDPKLTMTSQLPQKVSMDFSQIRGSRIRGGEKKKMNLCFSES